MDTVPLLKAMGASFIGSMKRSHRAYSVPGASFVRAMERIGAGLVADLVLRLLTLRYGDRCAVRVALGLP